MRTETRKERYNKKSKTAKFFPFEIATINFKFEENVAFIARSAACFGASAVNVIGSVPSRRDLIERSGTSQDLIRLNQFSNVNEFLRYTKENNVHLISADLIDDAVSIHEYEFPLNKKVCVIIGHETFGIPEEILMNSDKVYIPNPGPGFCLNNSQAGNIFLYEMSKRYAQL